MLRSAAFRIQIWIDWAAEELGDGVGLPAAFAGAAPANTSIKANAAVAIAVSSAAGPTRRRLVVSWRTSVDLRGRERRDDEPLRTGKDPDRIASTVSCVCPSSVQGPIATGP
ncbi:hypothetical protein GCM10009869_15790 [Amnibacterium kyonggiense]